MGAGTYWGKASRAQLSTCHEHIQAWADRLLAHPDLQYDLRAFEGHRPQVVQNKYHRTGRSKARWPHSYHNRWPSNAIDLLPIVNGKAGWHRDAMLHVGPLGLRVWAKMQADGTVPQDVHMRWGGDWDQDGDSDDERFFDGAHFEIHLPT